MRVTAPSVFWRATWIILRIVIARYVDRGAGIHVTIIFLFERITVIFKMVEDIERAMRFIFDQTGANFVACQEGGKIGVFVDIRRANFGPPADRDHEIIRKTPQIRRIRDQIILAITPECLFGQVKFGHPMEMINHRHAAPTHAKGGMNVGLRPIHDAFQLIPIGDVFEWKVFDRGACDDQTVKLFARRFNFGEGAIKAFHMIGGRVARLVFAHPDQ